MFNNGYLKDKIILIFSIPFAIFEHVIVILSYFNRIRKITPEWHVLMLVYFGISKKNIYH